MPKCFASSCSECATGRCLALDSLGDASTLADSSVVEELIEHCANR
ncbi:hypothetical protein FHS09_001358 [Microbulbifer rhizosphaerae]|uniref:Uncharacterized protein n=1 Tax=Microbulbifer rhizosphaerae TaxID=1562603 RepID=A0A7W4Z9S1_9GAMM|nr:hypothetical protein [Microbulbifer rhizosphaerae]